MEIQFFDDNLPEIIQTRRERKMARKALANAAMGKPTNKRGEAIQKKTDNKSPNSGLVLKPIFPKTDNQIRIFSEYSAGRTLNITGMAGTGKSFVAMYLALFDLMNGACGPTGEPYRKIVIIRSATPGKAQGFLPGSKKEKEAVYEAPYISICSELFGRDDAYQVLKTKGMIEFESTSYLRGLTIRDSIIILDEAQNCQGNEATAVVTRVGETSRFIMISDFRQTDLKWDDEREGYIHVQKVLKQMKSVAHIDMGIDDIVRSGFVKEYLIAEQKLK